MSPLATLFDAPWPLGCVLGARGLRQTAAQVWAGVLGGPYLGTEGALLQPAQVAWGYHLGSFQRPSGSYRRAYMGHGGAVTGGAVVAALTRYEGGLGAAARAGGPGSRGANTLLGPTSAATMATLVTSRAGGVAGAEVARAGYTAMQTDIAAMRRLRVTKGVYLPSDTPMHGIFGSKDVIHSWAIPGLGVKIDCIPGYSSHRRLVLRWRGLFWGQCMEVCGRYHH